MCFVVLLTSDTVDSSMYKMGVLMAAVNNVLMFIQIWGPTGIGGVFVENLLKHIEGKN